jgi:hypothetical protein
VLEMIDEMNDRTAEKEEAETPNKT